MWILLDFDAFQNQHMSSIYIYKAVIVSED